MPAARSPKSSHASTRNATSSICDTRWSPFGVTIFSSGLRFGSASRENVAASLFARPSASLSFSSHTALLLTGKSFSSTSAFAGFTTSGTTLPSFATSCADCTVLLSWNTTSSVAPCTALTRRVSAIILSGSFANSGKRTRASARSSRGCSKTFTVNSRVARPAYSTRYERSPVTSGTPPPKTGSSRFFTSGMRFAGAFFGMSRSAASLGKSRPNFASTTSPAPRSNSTSPGVTVTSSCVRFATARGAFSDEGRSATAENPRSASIANCRAVAPASCHPGTVCTQSRLRISATASATTRCWRKSSLPVTGSAHCSTAVTSSACKSGCRCSTLRAIAR